MPVIEFIMHSGAIFGFAAENAPISYLSKGDLVTIGGISCGVERVTTVDGCDRVIFNWAGATSWRLVSFRNHDWSGFDLFLSDPQTI